MGPAFEEAFGSPLAMHQRGRLAREAIERARVSVAALLHAAPEEILFTSSATEANNLALKGTVAAGPGRVIASATEHISVLHPLRSLVRTGCELVLLPVDRHGLVDPDALRRELRGGGLLVSVAHASAEIGTVQPIAELCRVARESGVPFHCDATASAGLLPWPHGPDQPDLVTLTAHLFNGPQGAAALRVAGAHRLRPLIEGGIQERGLRAGTQSLPALIGFGVAAAIAVEERATRTEAALVLAGDFQARLTGALEGSLLTGHPSLRLPGHVSLCVRGVEAEAVLRELDAFGVEAASGSACTTDAGKPSHVLEAIGVDPFLARGALTFMFGAGNGPDDPPRAVAALTAGVERLRRLNPLEGTA
jgi:cysteine desulfurase